VTSTTATGLANAAKAMKPRRPRTRRGVELAMLIFAVLIALAAYADVGLARSQRVPPDMLTYGLGLGALVVAASLTASGLGLADSLVWPLALVGAGLVIGTGAATFHLNARRSKVFAVVLIVVGVAVFVGQNTGAHASTLLSPGAVAVALLLVVTPWGWRLIRERDEEHAARVREQERADLAARVHDSVLQTLTLIQKEPAKARTLARRQERELRAWLYPDRAPTAEGTLADAIEAAAAEIEELHGVRVEIVRTGDAALDERLQALVLAAREAMANAARHSGVDEVSVFVDAGADGVSVYVRDRGAGFDPAAVADDRRGLADSIRGRMERVGGRATIVSAPGEGTEVELAL